MIYLFKCKDCGHKFSKELTYDEYMTQTIHACPSCHSFNTKRTYIEIPVIFKGEGFTKSVKEE